MTTATEYEQRISELELNELCEMWDSISNGYEVEGWAPGKAFEYMLLRAFQLEGAEVEWPYSVRSEGTEIEQIDGVVYYGGLACLIEAKDTSTKLNVEPIAKFRNQLMRRPSVAIGALFSRSGYTDPALTLVQFLPPQTILLWEAHDISHALPRSRMCQGLRDKFRAAVRDGNLQHSLIAAEIDP